MNTNTSQNTETRAEYAARLARVAASSSRTGLGSFIREQAELLASIHPFNAPAVSAQSSELQSFAAAHGFEVVRGNMPGDRKVADLTAPLAAAVVADRVVFSGGRYGEASIDLSTSDAERVLAHWSGYCENNHETAADRSARQWRSGR